MDSLSGVASRFVRRVRTASGAVAVQILSKVRGVVVEVEHIGSAHTDAELGLLLAAARERLHPGQGELDLGPLPEAAVSTDDVADWTRRSAGARIDVIFFDLGGKLGAPILSSPPIHLVGFEVFDFTLAVLNELRGRGLRLGVISNTGEDNGTAVDAVLERAEIRDFFEPALRIYSREVGLRKDSPRIFVLAAERAGEPASRCMFVGEDPAERAFAEQAGNTTVPHPMLVADVLDGQQAQPGPGDHPG